MIFRPRFHTLLLSLVAALLALSSCDLGRIKVGTTSKVLRRGAPAMKREADYEMAARAIPGALKTVESFWTVDPGNANLLTILTEGYCQYGSGFVEDEWERAVFAKNLDDAAYHNERATKMFTRCMNYALTSLGARWQKEIFEDSDKVGKLIASTGSGQRTPMMWAGIALGSIINHNLDSIEIIAHLPTVKAIIARVIEIDSKNPPSDEMMAALPHLVTGMLYSASSVQTGGDPQKAMDAFNKASELTKGKFLLPQVYLAYRVGRMTRNQQLFHDTLVKVLNTAPSIWPEQRLTNEVAHRRARRYLAMEKELFR